ncbi:MAG: hypothetical protein NTY65_17145 [Planctomycetota bacterium]|nr:hypothetical protein [Planctomycetota bacterium]
MHVWHRHGRVTKGEGNPWHPMNRGGLCACGQSGYVTRRAARTMPRRRGL